MEKNKKVLLIEDDAVTGRMYQAVLTAGGIDCTWVKTGEEGLQKVKEISPDIILLDVRLENSIDGFTVLQMLKKDSSFKIPVWLLTNIWETGNREKGLSLGAEEFLEKTKILPKDLFEKVKKRLG